MCGRLEGRFPFDCIDALVNAIAGLFCLSIMVDSFAVKKQLPYDSLWFLVLLVA
jgi:hypothetical protein